MYDIKKISGHASAQCYVRVHDDGAVELVSYRTTVVTIDSEGWLVCTGLYSRTTIKHIGWFMHEYTDFGDYYTAKSAYLDGYKLNIYTGEIVDL